MPLTTIADVPNSTKGIIPIPANPLFVDTHSFLNQYYLYTHTDINASISSFDHLNYQQPNYLISGALCSAIVDLDF